ncbi:MAG: hypothetical protein K2L86_10365 [Lachnospiraceae bacterium]|nr:hypothetical protein [Lachnospiraceae bacterium]
MKINSITTVQPSASCCRHPAIPKPLRGWSIPFDYWFHDTERDCNVSFPSYYPKGVYRKGTGTPRKRRRTAQTGARRKGKGLLWRGIGGAGIFSKDG